MLSRRMSVDKMRRLDSLKRRKPCNATHALVDCLQVGCSTAGLPARPLACLPVWGSWQASGGQSGPPRSHPASIVACQLPHIVRCLPACLPSCLPPSLPALPRTAG